MRQQIGEFLATLRKANGYTQQEIADKLGISNKTLSNWECNNVLPDILLLPALAELYGVTVDGILAGERKERNEVTLSSKAEKRILKSKIARFSMQCWILLGIIIAGLVLTSACSSIEASKVAWTGFAWWRVLLFVGIVAVIVSVSILFAFWKGAELSVDDSNDDYATYCIILRKRLANSLHIVSAISAVATLIDVIFVIYSSATNFWIAFAICAISLFVTAWVTYKRALVKFGGDAAHISIQKDRRYFWTVAFWGMIPFVLSVILVIVMACLHYAGVAGPGGVHYNYWDSGYRVAAVVIFFDVTVCAALCVLRRNKFAVKL